MNDARRKLLQALGSLPALALASPGTAATAPPANAVSIDQFAKLSATLTGYPAGDPGVAAQVLKAFATPARRAALTRLAAVAASTPEPQLDAAIRAQGLDAIANELVSVWYSGIATDGRAPQLILYTDAYVWNAMTFSKPMGVCGGPTGYWATPPQPT
jgi:hypothetical protein